MHEIILSEKLIEDTLLENLLYEVCELIYYYKDQQDLDSPKKDEVNHE
ncbi:MAG: hypothetical protein GY909_08930 [Oligoflexia bacterium]|nr:hypothetical protein [Oligoflexia bacterium]